MLDNKVILIIGGTGSFGQKFVEIILKRYKPKKLIVFSRDEYKQFQMSKKFPDSKYPIRYFIGDIRNKERLFRAFDGVDYVIHAAAMKHVPACEYNPFEAVQTNILGTQNIAEAALDKGVKKVIALSTDKAVNPVNLYGSTKLSMEKILIAANAYVGNRDLSFSLVRYGNVVGSRGSVIPFFQDLKESGVHDYPITDDRMSRFWITLEQGVELVLLALEHSIGGEIFVPKIPSMKIIDLLYAIDKDAKYHITGIRPGEKLHESLISEDEGRKTYVFNINDKSYFVILPQFESKKELTTKYQDLPKVPDNFVYKSDTNTELMAREDLAKILSKN